MEKRSQAFGNSPALAGTVITMALCCMAFTFTLPGELQKEAKGKSVRKAANADGFYPADKQMLNDFLDALLRQAATPKLAGPVRMIIVPHAGYIYSGPVAAYAYKAIQGQDVKTVILLGNSHRSYSNNIAIYKEGSFETPLGLVPIDEEITAKLLRASPLIKDEPDIHTYDHVLEVQLPFLQRTLKDFKIVPILFGNDSPNLPRVLAGALKTVLDDKTLVIISTDMSHYPPYDSANIADHETITAILSGKIENLDQTLARLEKQGVPNAETFLCGISGVRTALLLAGAEGITEIKLLKYANSGDAAGDKNRVVGYSAIAFAGSQKDPGQTVPAEAQNAGISFSDGSLNKQDQAELLKLARATVESYVKTGNIPGYSPSSPSLKVPAGAFVTLKKHGALRGCIGRFEPDIPLHSVIQQMAVAAATQDPRFPRVSSQELDQLDYEISVLSPLRKVASADEIELGKHGVDLKQGFHSGVFLPQVATETGWSKEEFLGELCSQKAGLGRDCWKDPKTDLYVFTAQVFSEEKK